jgi:predicted phage terminase large subunit-like protein
MAPMPMPMRRVPPELLRQALPVAALRLTAARRAAAAAGGRADDGARLRADTAAFAWHVRGLGRPDGTQPAHLADWYRALDDPDRRRLVILGPRESAKTTAVLTWALRLLVADRRTRIGLVSQTDALAVSFLRELAHELETNPRLQALMGGAVRPDPPAVWTQHGIQLAGGAAGKDLNVWACGAGGQVSGRRCDVLICDDLEDRDTVQSPLQRQRTREWFFRELLPTLTPDGKAVYVCTRKHHDDLASYLLRPGSGWEALDRWAKAVQPDGSSYWPDRWPLEALLARKAELEATDVHAWAQEYLNEPARDEVALFRPWEWPTFPAGAPPLDDVTVLQAWDLAISQRETADYTCGVTLGADRRGRWYVLDVRRGHWDFPTTQQEIVLAAAQWRPAVIGIEAVQYQAAAVQEVLHRTHLPVVPLVPGGTMTPTATPRGGAALRLPRDKLSRARLVEARAAAGMVLRPDPPPPWWPAFARELGEFPAGAHDDQADALAYAAALAQRYAAQDWGSVYGLTCCPACGGYFAPSPPGRPCPRCGARGATALTAPQGPA